MRFYVLYSQYNARYLHIWYNVYLLQIIPEQVSFDGEISECEDTSQHSNISNTMNSEESFDRLIPFHTLLDVSPNRSKAELAHKGALSQRQRPSADALRTAILRRTVSATSNVSQKYLPGMAVKLLAYMSPKQVWAD